jgi:hypothetical protein
MAEAQAQPQVQPQSNPDSRVGQEAAVSQKKNADEAVKAIYRVLSGYNGIVRKILETIEPKKGPWSTRKSVDQSTISYYSQVLKGLIEPLKHLMFQLSKVNEPTLSAMMSMIDNMIKMIDMSPPFNMIDSAAYKQGNFDYTGYNDDMTVGSITDYINLLTVRLNNLKETRDKYDTSKKGYLATIPKERRDDIKRLMDEAYKDADLAMDKAADEIVMLKQKRKQKLNSFEINQELVNALELSQAEIDELYLPYVARRTNNQPLDTEEIQSLYEGLASATSIFKKQDAKDLKAKKKKLADAKQIVRNIEAPYTVNGVFDMSRMPNQRERDEYAEALKIASRLEREFLKGDIKIDDNVGTASGNCGSGIDVNTTQQYNMMGRPVSNDQKINNDMINANRNWQIKNNGPHDTPLGNLNPFLAQDNASKYTYEVLLAKQNAEIHPEVNALGANISLLQGPIANISGSGSGKKSKAMDKIAKVAIDEKNDMFKPMEVGDKGYIPEEKEDQFKLPDLKPKKRK